MARRSPNNIRPARPSSIPARRKGIPLSPLAQQMLHDMQLAGLGERTHESYLRAVRKFAQWLKKSPGTATENDLRRYLLFIKNDQQWEPNSLKVAYSGLKFFYSHTCPREWPTLSKLRIPKQSKLPTVLTIPEVDQLIATIRKPVMKCFFWTVYSLGLRLQEALHLQVSDVDGARMLVHVRRGKGHKDRLVPLTAKTLGMMRIHWTTHRNPLWIFPREGRDHKQSATADQPIDPTTIYLHLTTVGEEVAVAKINALMTDRQGGDHV